ncbi:MAG TPA: molybdate ABC transporter substrate-binding protein [Jiangellaceae bacterium]|nr:molybdate ABC transporter substrate-binding protein [Jiangellaceae bacterium]
MKRPFALVAATLLVATAACGGDEGSGDGEADGGGESSTLTVFAAASLTDSYEQIGEQFEAANDGVEVEFSFAGSSDLVAQIQSGAPADVFASANEENMEKLTADGLEGSEPEIFATNILQIAVPPDNPASVESFQDLTHDDLNLVICAPEVPCGDASRTVADSAGITLEPVSEEQNVTDVLSKVTTGEADAGLVYVTDVARADGDVEGIEFPESDAAVNRYPIATTADSENAELAQQFVDHVLGDEAQQVLADAGFGQP